MGGVRVLRGRQDALDGLVNLPPVVFASLTEGPEAVEHKARQCVAAFRKSRALESFAPLFAQAPSPHLPAHPPPPPAAPSRHLRPRPSVHGTLQPRALTGPPRQSEH